MNSDESQVYAGPKWTMIRAKCTLALNELWLAPVSAPHWSQVDGMNCDESQLHVVYAGPKGWNEQCWEPAGDVDGMNYDDNEMYTGPK